MPAKRSEAERKLGQLAEHLRKGWKKLHPVEEDHLKKVRDAIQQEWEKEQAEIHRSNDPGQQKSTSHEQEHDHGHEH